MAKLTAIQQEVVNLMAHGWKLNYRYGFGDRVPASASLRRNAEYRRIAANIPAQLELKGVVSKIKKSWNNREYALTPLGTSLATEDDPKPTLTKWWRIGYGGIDASEFVSDTEQYLIRGNGDRVKKSSGYEQWFATREEAVAESLRRLRADIEAAQRRLQDAKELLAAFIKREQITEAAK